MTEEKAEQANETNEAEKPEATELTDPTDEEGGDELAKVRRETAKYRTRLREAEAERDQLAARLSDAQRAEVERQVAGPDGLQSASDFWTGGIRLDDLRDEEGGLDADKIAAAVKQVLAQHPHWRHRPAVDFDGGAREPAPQGGPSFGEAIKNAH
jgi:hypothetical protein